jgi:hypothetical protein
VLLKSNSLVNLNFLSPNDNNVICFTFDNGILLISLEAASYINMTPLGWVYVKYPSFSTPFSS